jgi:hypothetical protein
MRLFNKTIDRQLFKQYALGSDLSKQEVVAKIFNPMGAGTWFILNSDPNDPDYLWAIVDLGYGAEVGSVSRSDLETYRGRFGMGFERDLSFEPVNALELYNGLSEGKYYADGGQIEVVYERRADFKKKPIKLLLLNKGREQKGYTFSGKEQVAVLDNYNRNKQEDLEKLWNLKGYETKYADGGDIKEPKNEKEFLSSLELRALDVQKKYKELLSELDSLITKANGSASIYGGLNKNFMGISTNENKYQLSRQLKQQLDNAFYNVSRNNIESNINKSIELISKMSDKFADGGELADFSDNQRMIMNQNVALEHHHEELEDILEDKVPVPAWVVAKMETATQNLSDITHYLDGEKELMEDENEDENEEEDKDQEAIKNQNVVEPIDVSAGTKTDLTKNFTDEAMGNLRGFLKGMEGVDLRDDYTFDYKDEQYEVEPIINSDENGVSNAVFSIFDGDGEEVGDVSYSRDGGKQKFTANSEFFSWNNAKFEDGGYFDGTIPKVSTYMSTYADGGVFDSVFPSGTEFISGVYRTSIGIIAVTDVKNINGYDWHIVTKLPHYEGGLYTFAWAGKFRADKLRGLNNYHYHTEKDPLINLIEVEDKGRPMRNSEKKVIEQHLLALEIFKDKMKKGNFADGGFMNDVYADGGFIQLNRTSLMPQEWELVEWSLNGHSLSFKGRMYFQKGTGSMFIEKENGDIYEPKSNNKLYWRKIKEYAKGGVTYFDDRNQHYLGRPSGSFEKEIYAKVKDRIDADDFVGSFGWKISSGKKSYIADGFLYKLDDFDQNLIKDLKLKQGEKVFRYVNRTTAIGGMMPFIKINIEKALLYFPISNDNDDIIFETRGVTPLWINLIQDSFANGGKIDNKDLEKLNAYWQSFYKGIMAGKKDEGYITITNKDELNKYITSKLGNVVKNIELIEKGKNYPYNDSYPYYEDIYSVELKNGTTFKIVRSYGRPRWQGNVDYKEQIIVENIKQYADGGNVEKPLTRFRVGESFKYKNNGSIIYTVTKVYNDGACEARDEEGDNYSFEFDELNELVKAENNYADGGFMNNVYAKGGMVVTSVKDIPNFKERLEQRRITYRGLGMGKLADDFYDLAGTSGTRIKVDGKEYYITDKEFDTFSRDADGKMQIRFDAPARKGYADGGQVRTFDSIFGKTIIFKEEQIGKFTIGISSGFNNKRHVFIYEGEIGRYGAKGLPKDFTQSPQLSVEFANNFYSNLKRKVEYNQDLRPFELIKDVKFLFDKGGEIDYHKFYEVSASTKNGYDLYKINGIEDQDVFIGNYKSIKEANEAGEKLGLEKRPIWLRYGKGGKTSKFEKLSEKVAKEYEGKPVKSQYQKEYGKVYSKEEAQEVGDKVAGKVKAMQSSKKEMGGETKKTGGSEMLKQANILAKKIRKDGESWNDAKKRAFAQLKK